MRLRIGANVVFCGYEVGENDLFAITDKISLKVSEGGS